MQQNNLYTKNKRTIFSKVLKRKILLAYVSGMSPDEAFLSCGVHDLKEISNDKKYAAKLLHKWRRELSQNRQFMHILSHKLTKEILDDEIESFGTNEEINKDETTSEDIVNVLKTLEILGRKFFIKQ